MLASKLTSNAGALATFPAPPPCPAPASSPRYANPVLVKANVVEKLVLLLATPWDTQVVAANNGFNHNGVLAGSLPFLPLPPPHPPSLSP